MNLVTRMAAKQQQARHSEQLTLRQRPRTNQVIDSTIESNNNNNNNQVAGNRRIRLSQSETSRKSALVKKETEFSS